MTLLALTIKWFGQACFLITTAAGTNIVFDPFPAQIGRALPPVEADGVFVSHEHADHNALDSLKIAAGVTGPLSGRSTESSEMSFAHYPRRVMIQGPDTIHYTYVLTYHDSLGGSKRGTNTVRVIESNGVRICHLGDLGHLLTKEQIKAIGRVDVLMIPVGGVYTIDAAQAKQVVAQLKPKIVLPMHYKTPWLKVKLDPVNKFLAGYKRVKYADKLVVSKATLPEETTVVVLKCWVEATPFARLE